MIYFICIMFFLPKALLRAYRYKIKITFKIFRPYKYPSTILIVGAKHFLPAIYSMNEDSKESIINEAKIAATLDHPNICTIHEVGETEEEQIFIAMAYYEGETLKRKIKKGEYKFPL